MKRKYVKNGIAGMIALFLVMGHTASPMMVSAMTEDTVIQESEEIKAQESGTEESITEESVETASEESEEKESITGESELPTVEASQVPEGYVIPDLEDWKYTKNEDGTVTLWHYNGEDEKVYIPAYYGEAKVVLQAEQEEGKYGPTGVFEDCTVTGVAFDPEIKDADMYCMFSNCKNLTEVLEIPAGVTKMEGTFFECSSLTEAPEIPAGVTDMYGTFYGTGLIKAPVILSSVTELSSAFAGCKNLTGSITIYCIPENYKKVFDEAATNRRFGLRINYTAKNKEIMEEFIKESTGNIKKGIKVTALYKY